MLEGFKRNFKPLDVLTEGQVDAIWRAERSNFDDLGDSQEDLGGSRHALEASWEGLGKDLPKSKEGPS